jgi:hypothetical protein
MQIANSHPNNIAVAIFGIAVAISVFWVVPILISKMTGWAALATRFGFSGSAFNGVTWKFQSARMRYMGNYNNCLTVGANTQGLYLKAPFFMAGHPPLFVPWEEITYTDDKILWQPVTRFLLGRDAQIPFAVRGRLAEHIREAAGTRWPAKQPV